jgi:hypothetical protein
MTDGGRVNGICGWMDLLKCFFPQGTLRRVESGRLRTPDGKRVFYALRGHSEQIKPIGMRAFSMVIKGGPTVTVTAQQYGYKQSTDFHLLYLYSSRLVLILLSFPTVLIRFSPDTIYFVRALRSYFVSGGIISPFVSLHPLECSVKTREFANEFDGLANFYCNRFKQARKAQTKNG